MKNISINIINEKTRGVIDDFYIEISEDKLDILRLLLENIKNLIK